ncbi:hypothetical protein HG530_012145 [Fusarium avenaceum]|nr:hypothetical protein HG530_012145 [Fusarium avenaceum]
MPVLTAKQDKRFTPSSRSSLACQEIVSELWPGLAFWRGRGERKRDDIHVVGDARHSEYHSLGQDLGPSPCGLLSRCWGHGHDRDLQNCSPKRKIQSLYNFRVRAILHIVFKLGFILIVGCGLRLCLWFVVIRINDHDRVLGSSVPFLILRRLLGSLESPASSPCDRHTVLVAVYEDASSLGRVNWVSLDIVDASREVVSNVTSKLSILST